MLRGANDPRGEAPGGPSAPTGRYIGGGVTGGAYGLPPGAGVAPKVSVSCGLGWARYMGGAAHSTNSGPAFPGATRALGGRRSTGPCS